MFQGALVLALLAAGPDPRPTPTAPSGDSLSRAAEEHVARLFAEGPPRFSEEIEVRAATPEMLLQRFVKPEDVRARPLHRTASGTPVFAIDVLPLILALFDRGPKGPFFLYVLTTPHGRTALLREERIGTAALAPPGGFYEPAGRYETLPAARAALRELERVLQPQASVRRVPPSPRP